MTRSPRPVVGLGLLVGVVAISTSAILARVAMGEQPGVTTALPGAAPALAVAFWRTVGGAVALAPFALRDQLTATRVTRSDHRWLVLSGLALGLHFALFQASLALTSVASAVTLATASPVFVAVGAWWLLGEATTRRVWIGMALAMSGAITIGLADLAGHEVGGRAVTGDAMAIGSAVAMGAYLLVGRATRGRVHAATYSSLVYAWAALGLGAACLALEVPLWGYTPATWLALAGIVVGPQLLGHTVFNALLARVAATVIAIAVLAEPLGAGVLAWLLFAELPAPGFWLGAPLVLVGVGVATVRRPVGRLRPPTGPAAAGSDAPRRSRRSRP
jgi:drug/metabolite transporter (DMT)-like permease